MARIVLPQVVYIDTELVGLAAFAAAALQGISVDQQCFSLADYYAFYYTADGGIIDPLPAANDAATQIGCTEPESFFFLEDFHPTATGWKLLA